MEFRVSSLYPPFEKETCKATYEMFAEFHHHTIRVTPSQFPAHTSKEYMVWFNVVSHPRLIPREGRGKSQNLGVRNGKCYLLCVYTFIVIYV